jgi:hypothetical protein
MSRKRKAIEAIPRLLAPLPMGSSFHPPTPVYKIARRKNTQAVDENAVEQGHPYHPGRVWICLSSIVLSS